MAFQYLEGAYEKDGDKPFIGDSSNMTNDNGFK